MSAYHAWTHMNKVIKERGYNVSLYDVTEQVGILSVQGPNRYRIVTILFHINFYVEINMSIYSQNVMETLIKNEIPDKSFKYSTAKLVKIKNEMIHLIKLSFVDELGFELHIPKSSCQLVYKTLIESGKFYDMKHAGYRAFCSLSCEKGMRLSFIILRMHVINMVTVISGYLLWGSDLRTDDNPIEAGLEFTCRSTGEYLGKKVVDRLRKDGIKKKLVRVYLDRHVL